MKKFNRALSTWGNKRSLMIITVGNITEENLKSEILKIFSENLSSIKMAKSELSNSFYHEARFETVENAIDFFKFSFENPTKGVKVEPAANKVETAKYLSEEDVKKEIENGNLISGFMRISNANYSNAFISDPDGGSDLLICGRAMQNR